MHKHQSILRGAAEEFKRTGVIRTYDAVYRWVCPECGGAQRTTRLADTIYALRHAYGWEVATHAESGNLAVYTLVKAGDMPGEPDGGPHPRQLVRDYATQVANIEMIERAEEEALDDDAPIHPVIPVVSDIAAMARSLTGYSPYNGKPVPVEAIPSPTQWRCQDCDEITAVQVGDLMLGGWRKAKHCQKRYSIFVPVEGKDGKDK